MYKSNVFGRHVLEKFSFTTEIQRSFFRTGEEFVLAAQNVRDIMRNIKKMEDDVKALSIQKEVGATVQTEEHMLALRRLDRKEQDLSLAKHDLSKKTEAFENARPSNSEMGDNLKYVIGLHKAIDEDLERLCSIFTGEKKSLGYLVGLNSEAWEQQVAVTKGMIRHTPSEDMINYLSAVVKGIRFRDKPPEAFITHRVLDPGSFKTCQSFVKAKNPKPPKRKEIAFQYAAAVRSILRGADKMKKQSVNSTLMNYVKMPYAHLAYNSQTFLGVPLLGEDHCGTSNNIVKQILNFSGGQNIKEEVPLIFLTSSPRSGKSRLLDNIAGSLLQGSYFHPIPMTYNSSSPLTTMDMHPSTMPTMFWNRFARGSFHPSVCKVVGFDSMLFADSYDRARHVCGSVFAARGVRVRGRLLPLVDEFSRVVEAFEPWGETNVEMTRVAYSKITAVQREGTPVVYTGFDSSYNRAFATVSDRRSFLGYLPPQFGLIRRQQFFQLIALLAAGSKGGLNSFEYEVVKTSSGLLGFYVEEVNRGVNIDLSKVPLAKVLTDETKIEERMLLLSKVMCCFLTGIDVDVQDWLALEKQFTALAVGNTKFRINPFAFWVLVTNATPPYGKTSMTVCVWRELQAWWKALNPALKTHGGQLTRATDKLQKKGCILELTLLHVLKMRCFAMGFIPNVIKVDAFPIVRSHDVENTTLDDGVISARQQELLGLLTDTLFPKKPSMWRWHLIQPTELFNAGIDFAVLRPAAGSTATVRASPEDDRDLMLQETLNDAFLDHGTTDPKMNDILRTIERDRLVLNNRITKINANLRKTIPGQWTLELYELKYYSTLYDANNELTHKAWEALVGVLQLLEAAGSLPVNALTISFRAVIISRPMKIRVQIDEGKNCSDRPTRLNALGLPTNPQSITDVKRHLMSLKNKRGATYIKEVTCVVVCDEDALRTLFTDPILNVLPDVETPMMSTAE